ncbi:hypothetical protein ABW19_dt0201862 [Dactylella cylindrospora]|nr:hypothetical protein ABW19_dt0201862 [Dactylella cylindrospora]
MKDIIADQDLAPVLSISRQESLYKPDRTLPGPQQPQGGPKTQMTKFKRGLKKLLPSQSDSDSSSEIVVETSRQEATNYFTLSHGDARAHLTNDGPLAMARSDGGMAYSLIKGNDRISVSQGNGRAGTIGEVAWAESGGSFAAAGSNVNYREVQPLLREPMNPRNGNYGSIEQRGDLRGNSGNGGGCCPDDGCDCCCTYLKALVLAPIICCCFIPLMLCCSS